MRVARATHRCRARPATYSTQLAHGLKASSQGVAMGGADGSMSGEGQGGREEHLERIWTTCKLPTGAKGATVSSPASAGCPQPSSCRPQGYGGTLWSSAALQPCCSTIHPEQHSGPYLHGAWAQRRCTGKEETYMAAYYWSWALHVTGLGSTDSVASLGPRMGASIAMPVFCLGASRGSWPNVPNTWSPRAALSHRPTWAAGAAPTAPFCPCSGGCVPALRGAVDRGRRG